jgi:bifunctional DNase/RNase
VIATVACSTGAPQETTGDSPPNASSAREVPTSRAAETPPAGYAPMTVGGVAPTSHGNAVILTDPGETLGVFIFVGGTEALSLALRLSHRHYERPLTHDLLDNMLSRMEARIVSVRVDKLEEEVFHGTVVLARNDTRWELDARPSDAIALAVGNSAPIFVADRVVEEAGIDLEGIEIDRAGDPGVEKHAESSGQIEL